MSSDLSTSGCDLDQLIGLCDEISSLVRAGLPLEEALLNKSADYRNQLGVRLKHLADEIGTGKSLGESIRNDSFFPPVYAAVIDAGIESGNVAGALEAIAQNARTLRDARIFLLRTTLYPLVMFTALWFIFVGVFLFIGPRFAVFFEDFRITSFVMETMKWCHQHLQAAMLIMFAVPVILRAKYCVWAVRSARGTLIQTSGIATVLGWIPWIGPAAKQLQKATFAKIYAMLIRSSVPLDRAILLAAQATSDQYWTRESREMLQKRITGDTGAEYSRSGISSIILWSLGIPDQSLLLEGLDQYANIAEVRANTLLERCELLLPGIITFGFAAMITTCYLLTIVWPYGQALYQLSR